MTVAVARAGAGLFQKTAGRFVQLGGRLTRPDVLKRGLAAGGVVGGLALAPPAVSAFGQIKNPPLQTGTLDPDRNRQGDETGFLFDPRTGTLVTSGEATRQTGADRSKERNINTGIIAGAAALGGLALVLTLRGGK